MPESDDPARRRDLWSLLSPCRLCPRECRADRLGGELGFCGVGVRARVAAVSLHHGEEPPLSGTAGSGNIFFGGCNLRCRFCQNYPISQLGVGRDLSVEELAEAMLSLERRGAHNINLVTPSHVAPQAALAVSLAREQGLSLPVVWNSNGYETAETLGLLEGTVDIYLPDMKYADDTAAVSCSEAAEYTRYNRSSLDEMFRQVGHLRVDARGIATRGLIVRHLVLPGGLAGTREVLAWLAARFGAGLYLSLMSQYFPAHLAAQDPVLGRRLTAGEWQAALDLLTDMGWPNGWVQDPPQELNRPESASSRRERRNIAGCDAEPPGNAARRPSSGRA